MKKLIKKTTKKKATKKKLTGTSLYLYDRKTKAKKPGKRTSAAGNTYYESRRNRADADLRKKV